MRKINALLYIAFAISGLTCMKLGSSSLSLKLLGSFSFKASYIAIIGILLYCVSFIFWQKLLVSFKISVIVPITTGVIQIGIIIVGLFIFNEYISFLKILGILAIILGTTLISLKAKNYSN